MADNDKPELLKLLSRSETGRSIEEVHSAQDKLTELFHNGGAIGVYRPKEPGSNITQINIDREIGEENFKVRTRPEPEQNELVGVILRTEDPNELILIDYRDFSVASIWYDSKAAREHSSFDERSLKLGKSITTIFPNNGKLLADEIHIPFDDHDKLTYRHEDSDKVGELLRRGIEYGKRVSEKSIDAKREAAGETIDQVNSLL